MAAHNPHSHREDRSLRWWKLRSGIIHTHAADDLPHEHRVRIRCQAPECVEYPRHGAHIFPDHDLLVREVLGDGR